MSIRNQLIIVGMLSLFVVTPILALTMGLYGLIINAICTYMIFNKYWDEM